MITFYTRSQPYIYSSINLAIAALECGNVRDNLISAEITSPPKRTWLPQCLENEAEFRVRIVKDLRNMAEPMKLDQPILVQECAVYKRTYKRRISHAAVQGLIRKAYGLPEDTSFIWEDNPQFKCEAHYTVTTEATNAKP